MSDGGKGSSPRPIPDYEKYASNWDAIFKKPCGKCEECKCEEKTNDSPDIASGSNG